MSRRKSMGIQITPENLERYKAVDRLCAEGWSQRKACEKVGVRCATYRNYRYVHCMAIIEKQAEPLMRVQKLTLKAERPVEDLPAPLLPKGRQ